jgi:capsular exopolysaccharide synthesis family protein
MATQPVLGGSYPEKTLRDVYFVLFRQKKKAFVFLLFIIFITALATFYSAKIYQSTAEIMVRLGRENVTLDPTATTGQVVNIDQTRENIVRSEIEILRSQALAEKVVDSLGHQAILKTAGLFDKLRDADIFWGQTDAAQRERAKAIHMLDRGLEVEGQKNSSIISISYKSTSQELAHQVVSRLVDYYLEKHISVHRTIGSEEFFVKQVDLLRSKLAEAEENLKDLKNKSGIAIVSEQRSILLNRIGSLQKDLETSQAELSAAQAKVQHMQKILAGLPNTLLRVKVTGYAGNPVDYLQQRLTDLELKEQDMQSKFRQEEPLVEELRRQISEVRSMLKKEGATNSQISDLTLLTERARIEELQAKVSALSEDLETARSELGQINKTELEITRLTREIEILATNYRNYSEKMEQARIDRSLEMGKISNISIVQPAIYPVKPIRPRPLINIGLGIVLGLLGATGIAFFFEHMDHTFKKPEEVERLLKLPVMGAIPDLEASRETRAILGGRRSQTFPGGAMPVQLLGYFESIYSNLLASLNNPEDPQAAMAVTSYHRGEGTSTVAANLSAALAQLTGKRVLLVDTNLMNPSVHQIFGIHQSPGLIELFQYGNTEEIAIQHSPVKNLDLLPSGKGAFNLSAIYESPLLEQMMAAWRKEYSFVIFDWPALNETTAGIRMAGMMDAALLVIEAERTRWEVLLRPRKMLVHGRIKACGVVLNKRRFYIPGWLYRTI